MPHSSTPLRAVCTRGGHSTHTCALLACLRLSVSGNQLPRGVFADRSRGPLRRWSQRGSVLRAHVRVRGAPPPPPPWDIPSGCCFFTGPWTVTRSSLRMLRRVAAFCRPLRPVLLLVSFPRLRSPVVGVLGLCWMWHGVPFAPSPPPRPNTGQVLVGVAVIPCALVFCGCAGALLLCIGLNHSPVQEHARVLIHLRVLIFCVSLFNPPPVQCSQPSPDEIKLPVLN